MRIIVLAIIALTLLVTPLQAQSITFSHIPPSGIHYEDGAIQWTQNSNATVVDIRLNRGIGLDEQQWMHDVQSTTGLHVAPLPKYLIGYYVYIVECEKPAPLFDDIANCQEYGPTVNGYTNYLPLNFR